MRKLSKEPSMEIYHASQNITPYPANESEWDSFKKLTRKIWFMKMGHVLSPFYNQIWVLLREFFTSLIWPEHKGNPNWVDLAKWWIDLGLPNSLRRYPAEPVGCLLFWALVCQEIACWGKVFFSWRFFLGLVKRKVEFLKIEIQKLTKSVKVCDLLYGNKIRSTWESMY